MRKCIALGIAIGLAVAFAPGAAAAIILRTPPSITFSGGLDPAHLSKTKSEPVTLKLGAKITPREEDWSPVLETLVYKFDRNGSLFTKGLATCSVGQLTGEIDRTAVPLCQKALVGRGQMEFEIEFPEQPVFDATGSLEIFNSVLPGGGRAFIYFAHAHVPAPTTFYSVGAVTRSRGLFGMQLTIPIPEIVSGQGRVSGFHVQIGRSWTYRGRRVSLLSARCQDGFLVGEAEMEFADGPTASTKALQVCG
jgi:hypothetical protein